MEKKMFRGLSEKEIETLKDSDIFKFYQEHADELFLGVRNGYVNIYYKAANVCKATPLLSGKIKHTISTEYSTTLKQKYPDRISGGYINLYNGKDIASQFDEIKECIDKDYSNDGDKSGGKTEKTSQQKLIMQNNKNADSKWFCLDMEYIRSGKDDDGKEHGRIDIIAVSKEKQHTIALIELKYGSDSLKPQSGIAKHLNDFDKYIKSVFLKEPLIPEIVSMIKTYNALGIETPFKNIKESDFESEPKICIITLGKKETTLQTMRSYIFKDETKNGKSLSSKYNFEDVYTKNFRELSYKPVFYFNESNGDDIHDILDETKYEVGNF